ncbi:putative membrane protein [Lachnellula suecica]|uniref:Putative membrane protein n=1 Tax=Lachnellula suecica TaxID=602035 RepID=A0A8T9C0N8_9HELO|nr:putative membrane protein [Lachnellula suecica]
MADNKSVLGENESAGNSQVEESSNHLRPQGASSPPSHQQHFENFGPGHLQRAGTTPAQRRDPNVPLEEATLGGRRRGRTISSRPRNADAPPLSPRAQMLRRQISNKDHETRSPLPDVREGEVSRPRPSFSSSGPRFSSPGMRPRIGTWASPNRPRRDTLTRRPSVALAAEATATGRAPDSHSVANFTLAGPSPIDAAAANQPYVDPGYSDLNPAYDQPVNTRPVWGLAKPLPRVIRPGMVPTKSEIRAEEPAQEKQDPANVDLEQGRVEPTLRVDKISSQLQNARKRREDRLLQTYSRTGPSAVSPLRIKTSNLRASLSPVSQAIEEEDIGLGLANLGEEPVVPEHLQSPTAQVPDRTRPDWYPDNASSADTEHEQDDTLDGDWIGEEFPLKAYNASDDEIHNLHTCWSVIRLRFREPLAELLAVTVQLTLGFCADLVVTTSNSKAGNEETTDWAWGLATMVGIYIAGGISGAHLNPAISIMLYIFRGFPLRKVLIYILAQILGAFIAGLIAFGLYQEGIISYGGSNLGNSGTLSSFITYPRYDYIGASTAFFTEFTGTACLAVAVLALGDDTNAPPGAGMNAFILGLVVTVCSMAFGYNTGAAMNPSRDLGPRLAVLALGYGSKVFTHGYWVYGPWVGPITGAIFGAFLYDAAIFVGGESPVNYPRRRIKRAGYKWKKRWGRRFKKMKRTKKSEKDELANGQKI